MRRSWRLLAGATAGYGLTTNTSVRDTDVSPSKNLANGDKWYQRLWFKPETRDERIKEYVPEVLEESAAEQRALLAQQTTRDLLVEHGHKVLQAIENKAPTPSIAPSLSHLLDAFGCGTIISQRALSFLIYPAISSAAASARGPNGLVLPELVTSWTENFRMMIDAIERDGSYVNSLTRTAKEKEKQAESGAAIEGETTTGQSQNADGSTAAAVAEQKAEPMEVTMFVKMVSGMALANMHCNDLGSAVRCCDAALKHVVEPHRKGGVLALKAGFLVRDKQYEQAAKAALLAVEASASNVQGYLQGAAALRFLNRNQDAIELLESGVEANPQAPSLKALYDQLKKDSKLAIEATPEPPASTGQADAQRQGLIGESGEGSP